MAIKYRPKARAAEQPKPAPTGTYKARCIKDWHHSKYSIQFEVKEGETVQLTPQTETRIFILMTPHCGIFVPPYTLDGFFEPI